MKKEIKKNDSYEIYVDQIKNRFYIKLIGFWQDSSEVPDYLDDHKKALGFLSSGFTVLTDTSDMKTPPPKIMELHGKGLQMLNDAKIGKLALVVEQAIVGIGGKRVTREAGIEETTRQFNDMKEAEDWLDGKDV